MPFNFSGHILQHALQLSGNNQSFVNQSFVNQPSVNKSSVNQSFINQSYVNQSFVNHYHSDNQCSPTRVEIHSKFQVSIFTCRIFITGRQGEVKRGSIFGCVSIHGAKCDHKLRRVLEFHHHWWVG